VNCPLLLECCSFIAKYESFKIPNQSRDTTSRALPGQCSLCNNQTIYIYIYLFILCFYLKRKKSWRDGAKWRSDSHLGARNTKDRYGQYSGADNFLIFVGLWYYRYYISLIFLSSGAFRFNLKNNKESIITKVVIFCLEWVAKWRKHMVNNLFKNVYKNVL